MDDGHAGATSAAREHPADFDAFYNELERLWREGKTIELTSICTAWDCPVHRQSA